MPRSFDHSVRPLLLSGCEKSNAIFVPAVPKQNTLMRLNAKTVFLKGAVTLISPLVFFLLFSCNPTRRVPDGRYLLNKNVIIDRSASLFKLNPDIQKSDFEGYLKQKPNRKVLGFRFHLALYNLVDSTRAMEKKRKRNARWERDNQEHRFKHHQENLRRIAKNKDTLAPHLKDTNRLTWREWVMDIGEPPVLYDSTLKLRSSEQIRLFLDNKGYFKNKVTDSVIFKDKRANVFYIIHPNKPYRINKITWIIKDELLSYYVFADTANSWLRKGKNYDLDLLQKERERITTDLRNNGYYYFSKDYIYFKADSSLNTNEVNLKLIIRNHTEKNEDLDTIVETPHVRYYVNNIYVNTNYDPRIKKDSLVKLPPPDTALDKDHEEYKILYRKKLNYKPRVLTTAMFIQQGLFQANLADDTYKRLSELRAFKFINIQYKENGTDYLDCYINLTPILKQTFTVESEVTNTGGNKGVNGSFVYQNRNMFRGAELFEFRVKAGLEVQKLLTKTTDQNQVITESAIPFNTIEFGPEASITIPRFLLPFTVSSTKNKNPKTVFKANYNYQQRPDYTLGALLGSYGFNWNQDTRIKNYFYPIEISQVHFKGKEGYQVYTANDPLIAYRFTNHFTNDMRWVQTFSNQNLNKKRSYTYLRWSAETSGIGLWEIYHTVDHGQVPTTDGSYTIAGTKFSEYVRADFDWRYYKIFSDHNRIVFRFAAGAGYGGPPFKNLQALPIEKSFFAGGPTSIRAWKTRTLGPGSFNPDAGNSGNASNFDKVGDNHIEGNVEYRFNILRALNGAAFVDYGNIWLRKPDPNRPGGEIKYNLELLDEFAIAAGLGLRFDFSFFIVRLDAAFKVKDPARDKGDRWMFDHQMLRTTILNFGIGYPF